MTHFVLNPCFMKVSVSDNQNESVIVGPEVDSASLWTLLAILFLGAFVLIAILMFRMNSDRVIDSSNDSVNEPLNIDHSVDVKDADNDGIIDTGSEPATGPVTDTP